MTIEEAIKDTLVLREIHYREEVGNPQVRRDQDALKKKLCTCKLGSRFTCINIHYHGNHFFPCLYGTQKRPHIGIIAIPMHIIGQFG